MTEPGLSILCTGDIHLGRHPSRVDAQAHSPKRIWEQIVTVAIERDVDLVCLTGDVVDRDNRYFEALGPLEQGLRRLDRASIPTFAVSGNHDYDVLVQLADALDDTAFVLLGAGGTWEQHIVDDGSTPLARLVGWSYPERHVARSPLGNLEIDSRRDIPTIGLLHTEVDRPDSSYAPVASSRLASVGVDVWLFGHIHRPHTLDVGAATTALYPGTPQPLDPGETGVHGAWIVKVGAGESVPFHQIPLATVRYRNLSVDVEDVDDEDAFRQTVPKTLRADLRDIASSAQSLEHIVYRLEFTGRTKLHRRLQQLSRAVVEDLHLSFDGVSADVDQATRKTTPDLDLEKLAGDTDPPAVLAKLLLQIQEGERTEEATRLIKAIDGRIGDIFEANAYKPLLTDEQTGDRPDNDWIRRQIVDEGMALLDELLAQKLSN